MSIQSIKHFRIDICIGIFYVRYKFIIQAAVVSLRYNTGLFISPSGISQLDCATTKTDTAERSI